MSTRGGSQRDRQTAGRARPGEFHPAAGVTFRFSTGAQAALEQVFRARRGVRQTPYDLAARLVAAHTGDTVHVAVRTPRDRSMSTVIGISRTGADGVVGLRVGRLTLRGALAEHLPRGSLVAYDVDVETTAHGAAVGALLVRTLATWRDVGIARVHADLFAGRGTNGADFFVRHLGAEGHIPPALLPAVRDRFGAGVTRVEQLMDTPGGPAWWKAHYQPVDDATLTLTRGGRTAVALDRLSDRFAQRNRRRR